MFFPLQASNGWKGRAGGKGEKPTQCNKYPVSPFTVFHTGINTSARNARNNHNGRMSRDG